MSNRRAQSQCLHSKQRTWWKSQKHGTDVKRLLESSKKTGSIRQMQDEKQQQQQQHQEAAAAARSSS